MNNNVRLKWLIIIIAILFIAAAGAKTINSPDNHPNTDSIKTSSEISFGKQFQILPIAAERAEQNAVPAENFYGAAEDLSGQDKLVITAGNETPVIAYFSPLEQELEKQETNTQDTFAANQNDVIKTSEEKKQQLPLTINTLPLVDGLALLGSHLGSVPVGADCGGRTEPKEGLGPVFGTLTCGICNLACFPKAYLWDSVTKTCGCAG